MAIQHAQMQSLRRLTLSVAIFILVSNALTAWYFFRLGDDPLDISRHLSAYGIFASFLSVLGFFGAKNSNATLVTVFANFLVLDVLFSMIPRVLAITLFPSLESFICSPDSVNAWVKGQPMLQGAEKERLLLEIEGQCHNVLSALRVVVALVSLMITFVQCWSAVRVSQYARHLRHRDDEGAIYLHEESQQAISVLSEDLKREKY